MKKIVVTAGEKYTDIDVLACATSYAELLRNEEKDAEAVISGNFNHSITKKIRSWDIKYKTNFTGADYFVIVDTSYPKYFSSFVEEEKIIELYDHHTGYEDYFRKLLGRDSHIEMIGAAATLIWEQFENRSSKTISKTSANLLYTAIVSNTLNFNAQITNRRDHEAAEKLLKLSNLPANWIEIYFTDQEEAVFKNPVQEIIDDTHIEKVDHFKKEIIVGQLELWNSKKFIDSHLKEIKKALESFEKDIWFLTSPSISEGINYLYTENDKVKKLLTNLLNAKFSRDIGKTNKLWLRKEILKKMYEEKGG